MDSRRGSGEGREGFSLRDWDMVGYLKDDFVGKLHDGS